jgi:hypothetical protein
MAERMSNEKVTLEMSPDEAEALVRTIYLFGEHIAAGAPIPIDDYALNELVGAVYQRLLAITV